MSTRSSHFFTLFDLGVGNIFTGICAHGPTVFAASDLPGATIKTTLLAAMIVLIHLAWLLAGASLAGLLRDPLRSRIFNILLAIALVAMTALTLTS